MILTYEEGSGFSAFAIFNGIKLHFTSLVTIFLSITASRTLPSRTLPTEKTSIRSINFPENTEMKTW